MHVATTEAGAKRWTSGEGCSRPFRGVMTDQSSEPIVFYGYSDDCVEVGGRGICEEFGAFRSGPGVGINWSGLVVAGEDSVRVRAIYDGSWSFAVSSSDSGTPLPEWRIEVRQSDQVPYSSELRIHAPDGASVRGEADG